MTIEESGSHMSSSSKGYKNSVAKKERSSGDSAQNGRLLGTGTDRKFSSEDVY